MPFFAGSVRRKILLLVLFAVLPALGFILYSAVQLREREILDAQQQALRTAQRISDVQEHITAGMRQLLSTLSHLRAVRQLDAEACNALFKTLLDQNEDYANILLVDRAGDLVASATPSETVNLSDRKHFKDAMHNLEFTTGEYVTGRIVKTPMLPFAYPVLDPAGNRKGVLVSALKLEYLDTLFSQEPFPPGSILSVADHRGVRLYRFPADDEATPIGSSIDKTLWDVASGPNEEGITIREGVDGVRRIYAFRQHRIKASAPPYLYIMVGIPEGHVYRQARAMLTRDLLLLGLAALLAFAAAWLLGRKAIGQPVDRLVAAARRIGQGDLATRSGIAGEPGEFGELARSFDEMAEALSRDMAGRRQAKEALAGSEERIRAIFNATSDSIILMDTQGTVLAINEHGAKRRNLRPSEIVGKVLCDYLQPEIAKTRTAKVREIVRTGKPLSFEEERDGRHYLLKMYPVFDTKGKVIQLASFSRDITEHKQTTEALAKSEEKFRTVADFTYDWEYWLGPDGRLVWMSPSCELVAGYAVEEFMADPELLRRLVHPEDSASFDRHLLHVERESIEAWDLDVRIKHRSGETVWINHYCVAISRPDGTPLGRRASNRDITARKRAEEEIRDLAKFPAENPNPVLRVDLRGTVLYANKSAGNLLNELQGPDGTFAQPYLGLVAETMAAGKPLTFELALRDKYYLFSFSHITEAGYVNIYGQDITGLKAGEQALRESEARFRLLVEQAPEAILVHDVDLDKFVDANANAERLFGCPRNDLLQFGPQRFYLPNQPDARPVPESFQDYNERALAGETVVFERAIRNAQGKALLCEVRLVRLPSAERGLLRASFIDITGRKELEAQLFQAQKLEAVGQLIAGIAHEINTPTQYVADNTRFLKTSFADIATLFGMVKEVLAAARQGSLSGEIAERLARALDTLDVDFLEKEVPQAIEQTLEGIERISTIVKSVRRFAHPGKELKEPNDLNEAIRTTITVSRNEWRYVAELRADLDEGLPLVPCVVGEINQVVLNLIVNAAHAIAEKRKEMPDSIGLIIVTTRRTGPWAEIRVQDTGAGIPEEVQPHVFDPFFTTKEIGKGTGQGLAISRKVVVEKHQGTIFFETVPGQGTTFVVRLPLEAQLREAS